MADLKTALVDGKKVAFIGEDLDGDGFIDTIQAALVNDAGDVIGIDGSPLNIEADAGSIVDLDSLLLAFNNEDFATETTLDTRLSNLETKLDDVQTKLDAVNTNIDDSQDSDNNFNVSQNGSIVATDADGNIVATNVHEVRCKSTDTKPTASEFPPYCTLIEMDTSNIFYNDNGTWVVY